MPAPNSPPACPPTFRQSFSLSDVGFVQDLPLAWRARSRKSLMRLIWGRRDPGMGFKINGFEHGNDRYAKALGSICGIGTHDVLADHDSRLARSVILSKQLFKILVALLVFGYAALAFFGVRPVVQSIPAYARYIEVIVLFTLLSLLFMASVVLCGRLSALIAIRRFADSWCAFFVLRLWVELRRDDVLRLPTSRTRIVAYFHRLASLTRLLPFQYGMIDTPVTERLRDHFQSMSEYLQAREHWAAVPSATTLGDLREDVRGLADIYVNRRYGDFRWPFERPNVSTPSIKERALHNTPRVLGHALPLGLMGFALLYPQWLIDHQIPISVVAFVFLGWFLVTLDHVLNLGVVSNILAAAKSLKDIA